MVLPMALADSFPPACSLPDRRPAGGFHVDFAGTVNAAPPYFVNDIYKRYINPNAAPKTYVV